MENLVFRIMNFILAIITLTLANLIARKFAKIISNKNLMDRDIEMYKIKYSEDEILTHLDFIITECLDYYITMNLTPKQLFYINNATEKELVTALGNMIPDRISPTLYSQLSLIYDSSQIATVIGEKIYLKVLNYVIEFNVQNEFREKNKKPE